MKHKMSFLPAVLLAFMFALSSCNDLLKDLQTPLYHFHSVPEVLPEGTDGTAGKDARYVLFGDWPQSKKADDVKIYSRTSITMGGSVYYMGGDGNYYAKEEVTGEYFKVEPIKWRIVEDDYNDSGRALLLAENILTSEIQFYGLAGNARKLNEESIDEYSYKYSNMRAYLNGMQNQFVTDGGTATDYEVDWSGKGFLQTAFTDGGQKRIALTSVKNRLSDTDTSLSTQDTEDRIFILSLSEVSGGSFNNDTRKRGATGYVEAQMSKTSLRPGKDPCWWLRTPWLPSMVSYMVDIVNYVGSSDGLQDVILTNASAYNSGDIKWGVGIVPALCIELD